MTVVAPLIVAALVSRNDTVAVIDALNERATSDGGVQDHDVVPVRERGHDQGGDHDHDQ